MLEDVKVQLKILNRGVEWNQSYKMNIIHFVRNCFIKTLNSLIYDNNIKPSSDLTKISLWYLQLPSWCRSRRDLSSELLAVLIAVRPLITGRNLTVYCSCRSSLVSEADLAHQQRLGMRMETYEFVSWFALIEDRDLFLHTHTHARTHTHTSLSIQLIWIEAYLLVYIYGGIGYKWYLDVELLSQCHYICILKQTYKHKHIW